MKLKIEYKRVYEIIDQEIEFARGINPLMALGMVRIRELIEKENNNE